MIASLFLATISASANSDFIKTTYGYGYGYGNNDDNSIENNTNTPAEENILKKASSKKDKKKKEKRLKNSQNSVRKGEILTQSGKGFKKNSKIRLYFSKSDGSFYPPVTIKTDGDGKFSIKYLVTKPEGTYKWYAVTPSSGKKTKTSTYKIVK